mmetsp:Transcript_15754/g.23459  ORF Transcript_15754/g.23459 Transcript_15754/m.23459 type:complete len:222 (-) Transcript_15754:105-770(-)
MNVYERRPGILLKAVQMCDSRGENVRFYPPIYPYLPSLDYRLIQSPFELRGNSIGRSKCSNDGCMMKNLAQLATRELFLLENEPKIYHNLEKSNQEFYDDTSISSSNDKNVSPAHCNNYIFPHESQKYAEIYNKNGHIGIYSKGERANLLARFFSKREERVWGRKIRYKCRKNLADIRLRKKGRFIKMSEVDKKISKFKVLKAEKVRLKKAYKLKDHPKQE